MAFRSAAWRRGEETLYMCLPADAFMTFSVLDFWKIGNEMEIAIRSNSFMFAADETLGQGFWVAYGTSASSRAKRAAMFSR